MHVQVWPEARVAKLQSRLAKKKSFSEIADELGVTRNAVAGRAWRLKNVTPKSDCWWTAEQDARITELWKTREPVAAVAEKVGRTVSACYMRKKFLRLPRNPKAPSA
jgi:hypothetical protein